MKRLLTNRWLIAALRIAIGAVFVYAGSIKVIRPVEFADAIASFQIIPKPLINIVALGLPPFEVLVGLMMIFGLRRRLAAFGVLLLSLVFTAAIALAICRGLTVDCGCFGSGPPSQEKTIIALARDVILLAAAVWLYWAYTNHPRKDGDV